MQGIVRAAPIFVFKGIDPKAIIEKYYAGFYSETEIPSSQIKPHEIFHVTTPSYGTSPEDARYQFKDKNNTSVVIVTTNSKTYDVYKRAKYYEDKEQICPWCLRIFDDEPSKVSVRHQEKQHKDKRYDIFWTINVNCCNPRCALAWCERESHIDPLFTVAYENTKLLYQMMFPGEKIRKAANWRLLETNDGSLTEEEFDKNKYTYERTSNIIILPAKEEFIQCQLA